MKHSILFSVAALLATPFYSHHSLAREPLTEIVVTAELLEGNALELPNSVSVIDAQKIEQRSAQHLEDLLNLAPNVNFTTGASRGRFIQIRGIGERSEFQEPIINSVGVLIDGIDFTGIASAASTLDIQQVEVLRGPQGTLFGANALAGLINIVSNAPSDQPYAKLSGNIEEYGGLGIEGVVSGPTSAKSAYRLAVKHYQSDGFTNNVFLNRDDTNNINETTARGTFTTDVSDDFSLDFTVFLADVDNGFDAFSLDNNRQTYSDKPGVDSQETVSGSIKAQYQINSNLKFEGLFSLADSDLVYSFDEDWSHTGICGNTACDSTLFGFDWYYSSFDNYQRGNKNTSIDLRLIANPSDTTAWLLGVYHRDQRIDLNRVYTFNENDFSSRQDTQNSALYGQVDVNLNRNWSITTGLRIERRAADYSDSTDITISPDENLWGGRIALEYKADSGAFYYGLISRGYKSGGFNADGSISPEQREFDTETMINYELGIKNSLLDDRLQIQAAVFYQQRDDIQTKQSIVASIVTDEVGGTCPCSFTDFIDNAAGGDNYGFELEFNWASTERLSVFGSLGLLETQFDTLLSFEHTSADRDNGIAFNLKGREQAQSPNYQVMLGGAYNINQRWLLSASVEAKDSFYFSNRHDLKSTSYEIFNAELSYQADTWNVALYAKNLGDKLITTRGFGSFGNDPRKFYETEAYNQFAAPRIIGVKGSIEF